MSMGTTAPRTVRVRIARPDGSEESAERYTDFEVPVGEGQSVMNLLQHVYENLDRTVCFYAPCRIGKCFGCHARVNGKTRLICTELVPEGVEELVIEPMSHHEVIRDLVTDRSKLVSQEERQLERKAEAYLSGHAVPEEEDQ